MRVRAGQFSSPLPGRLGMRPASTAPFKRAKSFSFFGDAVGQSLADGPERVDDRPVATGPSTLGPDHALHVVSGDVLDLGLAELPAGSLEHVAVAQPVSSRTSWRESSPASHDQHSGSDGLMPDVGSSDFGFDMARPERRYDVAPVRGPAGPYLVSLDDASGVGVGKRAGSGGRVGTLVMKMAGFALATAVLTSCAGGGNIEVPESPSRSASQLPTLDGVPADPHEVGYAPGDSQSDAEGTESRSLIEPASRGTDTHAGTDTHTGTDSDAIGGDESLAVTDPRGDHDDPDSHRSAESVDCHPVGDDQRIAECQPVAVLVRGGGVCRNRRRFLVLVGAGGFIACSRDSDAPSRAETPSTGLEG